MSRTRPYNRIIVWLLVLALLLALAPMAFADEAEETPAAETPAAEAPAEEVPAAEPQSEATGDAQEPQDEAAEGAQAEPGEGEAESPDSKDKSQPESKPKTAAPAQEEKPFDVSREKLTPAQEETCRRITEFLREQMGLNNAAIAGILASIHQESSYDYAKEGDFGLAYGLCQWREVRKDRLIAYCAENELDYTTVEGQLLFLDYELKTYYPDLCEFVLFNAADSVDGAERAAYYFCHTFEAPTELERCLKERRELAMKLYYPMLTAPKEEPQQTPETSPETAPAPAARGR